MHNCAMLPITKSYREMGIDADEPDYERELASDWFLRQDEATQRRMMGPGHYDAWKQGLFRLEDMAKLVHSDVWGDAWVESTLRELVGDTNAGA